MKNIILILALVISSYVSAQSLTKTVNVIGTKDELYVKANLWLVDILYDTNVKYQLQALDNKACIQYSDRYAGIIKGRHILYYSSHSQWDIEKAATIILTVGDNKMIIKINCNDKPQCLVYSQNKMNKDLNDLIQRFNF